MSKPEEKNENKSIIEENKERALEVAQYVGKNNIYLRKTLKDVMLTAWKKTMMVNTLQSNVDEKGRVVATTRLLHYANTAWIAGQITRGLFPGNKNLELGVSTIALYHDFGQNPFGHNGEAASTKASKQNNGGPMLHNIVGKTKILFRYSDKIKEALICGRLLDLEAKKRNIKVDVLKERISMGLEPQLETRIQQEYEKNEKIADDAVKLIALSAGNHNGERGTANIIPNYERTFEDAFETAKKTFLDANEDKNMVSCNIIDAIVKISDQISSIVLDVIDGKRSGIEDEIYEGWAEPIAKILQISEEEARLKLKGNNDELQKLAYRLQKRLIENVIESSSKDEINMTLAPYVYGRTDKQGQVLTNGLRTFNMREHTTYTATAKSEVILNNMMIDLTRTLANSVLEADGTFSPKLNELFRMSGKNQARKIKERELIDNYKGNQLLKDFYRYIAETTSGEYQMNKQIVKQREVQYYRDRIEKALSKRENLIENIDTRSPRKTTNYLIEEYILSPSYEAMQPNMDGTYSDEEVKKMLDRINAFLHSNPVEGMKHLSLLTKKSKYQLGEEGEVEEISTGKVKLNTDQQIAARFALGYLNELNEEEITELAYKLQLLTKEEKDEFHKPYRIYSGKRTGDGGNITEAMKGAMNDYKAGSTIEEK